MMLSAPHSTSATTPTLSGAGSGSAHASLQLPSSSDDWAEQQGALIAELLQQLASSSSLSLWPATETRLLDTWRKERASWRTTPRSKELARAEREADAKARMAVIPRKLSDPKDKPLKPPKQDYVEEEWEKEERERMMERLRKVKDLPHSMLTIEERYRHMMARKAQRMERAARLAAAQANANAGHARGNSSSMTSLPLQHDTSRPLNEKQLDWLRNLRDQRRTASTGGNPTSSSSSTPAPIGSTTLTSSGSGSGQTTATPRSRRPSSDTPNNNTAASGGAGSRPHSRRPSLANETLAAIAASIASSTPRSTSGGGHSRRPSQSFDPSPSSSAVPSLGRTPSGGTGNAGNNYPPLPRHPSHMPRALSQSPVNSEPLPPLVEQLSPAPSQPTTPSVKFAPTHTTFAAATQTPAPTTPTPLSGTNDSSTSTPQPILFGARGNATTAASGRPRPTVMFTTPVNNTIVAAGSSSPSPLILSSSSSGLAGSGSAVSPTPTGTSSSPSSSNASASGSMPLFNRAMTTPISFGTSSATTPSTGGSSDVRTRLAAIRAAQAAAKKA